MRSVPGSCVTSVSHSTIRFEENNRTIYFQNPSRKVYKCVQVDGCAMTDGIRCDKMLTSADEHSEHYVELKGTEVGHAIRQLQKSIETLGEYNEDRHAYVVSTNVMPAISTLVQKAKKVFKERYNAELRVKERVLEVTLG